MILRVVLLLTIFVQTAFSANSSLPDEYVKLTEDSRVVLPMDLFLKENFISQWWYITGHLETEKKEKFGYELTFFAVNVNKHHFKSSFGLNRFYISHFAITDIDNNKYYFFEDISRGAYGEAGALTAMLNVFVFDDVLTGDMNRLYLKAEDIDVEMELFLTLTKPPVLHGAEGYSNKVYGCSECASLYFSFTNLATEGVIKIGNKKYKVTGKSWFDREINSDYDASVVKGWDWFAIMFDDNTEVMIYRIRDKDGKIDKSSYAVFIDENGEKEALNFDEISFQILDYYVSKKSNAKYPVSFRIKIPAKGVDIVISPYVRDQEFVGKSTTLNSYWEGACKVSGTHSGKAYMELTGY